MQVMLIMLPLLLLMGLLPATAFIVLEVQQFHEYNIV